MPKSTALFFTSAWMLLCATTLATECPKNLRCEWRVNPDAVADPCPEFYWESVPQSAFRILVAKSPDALANPADCVWDSGKVASRLSIAEYAGPRLPNGVTHYWRLEVWDRADKLLPAAPSQQFALAVGPMRHHLPSIRTFINFAGNPDFAREWLDLSFRKEAKQGRPDIITTCYGLVTTMVLPHPSTGKPLSGKAKELADFCVEQGLTKRGILEEMFCHFAQDTPVRLHVGTENTSSPIETRVCPGWDPANDGNGDGRLDDAEFAKLKNPKARARRPREARIPIYFWGPPRDDFVMNVGHPKYQQFMATVHAPRICEGYDGIYFDTVPTDVSGAGRGGLVLEYPRKGKEHDRWLRDLQVLFAKMKLALPDKIITGNGWNSNPMVIDGRQKEGWQRMASQSDSWKRSLDVALDLDRRGKFQLIQYNPIFHPELATFGVKLPIGYDRDKLFGLATYFLAHGDFSYFGFGSHPYRYVTKQWFKAMQCDIGRPEGAYYLFAEVERGRSDDMKNLLTNGHFETADARGKPADWKIAEPVELDTDVKHGGSRSARITSTDKTINNINKQYVKLKPNTTYTLIAWVKVDGLEGGIGAGAYPYDFDGSQGGGPLVWKGTADWHEMRTLFTTGTDAEGRINFRVYGSLGTAWFDDIQLYEGAVVRERVFARKYTGGLVLAKPYVGGPMGDATRTTHKLPGTFRPLKVDGTLGEPTTQVRLANGEAAILVK